MHCRRYKIPESSSQSQEVVCFRRLCSNSFEPMSREDWMWKTPAHMRTGFHISKKIELDSRKEDGLQGWSKVFLPRQQYVFEPEKTGKTHCFDQ